MGFALKPATTKTEGGCMFNLDTALGIHPQAALLRAQRAELIAGNLANADTPNYQARDFDFNAALEQAIGGNDTELRATGTQMAGHVMGDTTLDGIDLQYRTPTQASLDQNSVDVQGERSRFLDNAMRYPARVRCIEGSLSGLLSAIRGG